MSGPWGGAPFLPPRAAGTAHIHDSHCITSMYLTASLPSVSPSPGTQPALGSPRSLRRIPLCISEICPQIPTGVQAPPVWIRYL